MSDFNSFAQAILSAPKVRPPQENGNVLVILSEAFLTELESALSAQSSPQIQQQDH